ncbi:hypothetical protein PGTUg99_008705 [Puccinia graminis f. sp. tritici]|uniref:Wax synthase domain-containing protein n=1 Tax=Puccinia graminis f. sp. tritici TaxID=56615 RepID=A0A5B0NNM9_PUCGR|nr:hypothetical protein PGTUg99_008705 [Puccinia graminis f. sp. tritici]
MSWMNITSHLIPMAIQAGLHCLIWTHPDCLQKPIIRWTRLALLPITLSLLFSDLATLKYERPKLKFNVDIALMFAIHGFKSILLTFNEPAIPAPKSKDHTDSQSLLPSLGTIVSLVFFNVYKSAFVEAGSAPTIHFLVKTCGSKPDLKIVRLSGIMGAFAISAVVHEIETLSKQSELPVLSIHN